MGEYISVVRLPLAVSKRERGPDITKGLFVPNDNSSAIMFGPDSSAGQPDRMFCAFTDIPTVFVNPERSTPRSGEHSLKTIEETLRILSDRGATFYPMVFVNDLDGPRRQPQIAISGFRSQVERAFKDEAIIKGISAFRVGEPITVDQILAGQFPDPEPMALGNMEPFRFGWNRAGITQ